MENADNKKICVYLRPIRREHSVRTLKNADSLLNIHFEKIYDRCGKEQCINAVKNAAVPGKDDTGIFDSGEAFEFGFKQIADLSRDSNDKKQ